MDTTTVYITEPLGPNDVAAGRGARIKAFVGNVRFRQLVQLHKIEYMSTGRHFRKQEIAQHIYSTITQERGGRFVAPVTDPTELQQAIGGEVDRGIDHASVGIWKSVAKDRALKKIKQALCEDEVNIPRSPTMITTPSGPNAAVSADLALPRKIGNNEDSSHHRSSHRSDTTTTTAAARAAAQHGDVPSAVALSGTSTSSTLFQLFDPNTTTAVASTAVASTAAAIRAAQQHQQHHQLRINHQLQLMLRQQVQQQSALAQLLLQRQQLEQIMNPVLLAQQQQPPTATLLLNSLTVPTVLPQQELLAPSLSSSTPFMMALMSRSGTNSVGSILPLMNGNAADPLTNNIDVMASPSSLLPVQLAPPTYPAQIIPTVASITEVMTVPLLGATATPTMQLHNSLSSN